MKQELAELVDELAGKKILILGDMVADVYLDGVISRISREAPVLVLEQVAEKIVPGGAANVVNNVATLGGKAFAVGVLGCDNAAAGLKGILAEHGVDTSGLFGDETRPTIAKTRIIAGGRATVSQQIVRIDRESKAPLSAETEKGLLASVDNLLATIDGVVLSDYGSGTITSKLGETIIQKCREQGIPTIVDSRYDIRRFRGIDYVKQNDAELAAAMKTDFADEQDLITAGQALLKEMDAKGVLVTRGDKGMMLFEADGEIHDIPVSDRSEVFDVSGAGDTCVATVILALAAGAAPVRAAELSNFASGIAVRKMGTATVSASELKAVVKA